MNAVVELFGKRAANRRHDWKRIIQEQQCPFLERTCYKVRKSDPDTSIGTCTVLYGKASDPVLICPTRLIHRGQVFTQVQLVTRLMRRQEVQAITVRH